MSIKAATRAEPAKLAELSSGEAEERHQLREAMRRRKSVDHFAQAWYGGVVALVLTGVSVKLAHDGRPDHQHVHWGLFLAVAGCLSLWSFVIVHALRTRRWARLEQAMLDRLEGLDARAPKAPELF